MSGAVVTFEKVWKKFRRGERHDSLRDLIPNLARRAFAKAALTDLEAQEFWAVKNVSFEVSRGEAVGIIGPNGAGKSTALKLLTRILRPTRGACSVRGRVGALIEVAAGFHPDLTGRENIYLQGAIMGMRRAQIEARFDEIVEFSGVSAFIDTQVKRYSSGMQARLGFSVAAHMDPDVLIVDEVLSVGDMSFQAKCMDRMRQQIANGVTVVFVSHNLQAVANLCSRCIVLGGGQLLFDGPPEEGLSAYMRASQTFSARHGTQSRLRVQAASLRRRDRAAGSTMPPHTSCELRVVFECLEDTPPATVGIELERTRDLFYCYGAASEDLGYPLTSFRRGQTYEYVARFCAHLARGHYRLNVNIRDPRAGLFYMFAESVADFAVKEDVTYDGVVDIELETELILHAPDASSVHAHRAE
jgi:lipopolysaccharide transport system ATP-binding protein